MTAVFWTGARKAGQHSPSVQPTWQQMKHPSWQIINKARWQATAQCRSGSTLVTLLRVTDVHENCTSTRPYTTKYRDKTEKIQGQEPVLLQPREFWLVAGNPHCCRMCFGLIITTSGKNIQVDIITSVFLFDDCCFTRN